MNQKRSWPGVPNRYSTRSDRKLIRPKSMATVVVVLRSTPAMSSTPTLRSLSSSSVRSGRISLIDATRVVLPAPKPPAIRILVVTGRLPCSAGWSERLKSIKYVPQQSRVGYGSRARWTDAHQALLAQVAEEHANHPDREVKVGGNIHDGHGAAAHAQDPALLGAEPEALGGALAGRQHEVDQAEGCCPVARQGPALGHGVGPDHRSGGPVQPAIPRSSHGRSPCGRFAVDVPGGSPQVLAHAPDQHGHLIGDQADAGAPGAQDGQAGAFPGRHDEQERRLHLDDRLPDLAAVKMPSRSAGQALHAGREGGKVLTVLLAQVLRRRHDQAVPGQDHGLADGLDAP